MKAAVMDEFHQPLTVRDVADPELTDNGVLIRVQANGICRSDWHAWVGDWPKLFELPHVLGHEMCGVVEQVGHAVTKFSSGERVIVPFSGGDGTCTWCRSGHANLCEHPVMTGIRSWGAFGELVAVEHADFNLVRLPDNVSFVAGASMGCRYMTAFHALTDRARVGAGEWVAVHGCGGVGLAVVQIATALGANVIAIDINPEALEFARQLGAVAVVNAQGSNNPSRDIKKLTAGGAHVSVDALGIAATCRNALKSLRKRGRHVQVGLTTGGDGGDLSIPIDLVVQNEIRLIGSFGMPPADYDSLLRMLNAGRIDPGRLVTRTVALEQAGAVLTEMDDFSTLGITVIDQY